MRAVVRVGQVIGRVWRGVPLVKVRCFMLQPIIMREFTKTTFCIDLDSPRRYQIVCYVVRL